MRACDHGDPAARRGAPAVTRRHLLAGVAAAVLGAACSRTEVGREPAATPSPTTRPPSPSPPSLSPPSATPSPPPPALPLSWRPSDAEVVPLGKTFAAEVAEALATADATEDPAAVLSRAVTRPSTQFDAAAALAVTAPLVEAGTASTGATVYAQLGGLDPLSLDASYASVMVVLLQDLAGTIARPPRQVVRTVDLRLRVVSGAWVLDQVASLGGEPVERPPDLPAAAVAVLDAPQVTLPDSARWDIHLGRIDGVLLEAMAQLAQLHPYAVTVLASGHPEFIIDGGPPNRRSSHVRGRAVDIWSVGGRSVREQAGDPACPARQLFEAARALPALTSIGAPLGWDVDGPGKVFDDPVHEDHLHLSLGG